jgi:hypothetical protein
MKEGDHWKAYKEYRDSIFEWALEIKGLDKSQRIIGLNASRAIVELLSAFLHRKRLIDEGFQLNHRWFKSERVKERLPEFKYKDEIVRKMVELENSCEKLAYGSPRPIKETKKVIELFKELERQIKGMMDE